MLRGLCYPFIFGKVEEEVKKKQFMYAKHLDFDNKKKLLNAEKDTRDNFFSEMN